MMQDQACSLKGTARAACGKNRSMLRATAVMLLAGDGHHLAGAFTFNAGGIRRSRSSLTPVGVSQGPLPKFRATASARRSTRIHMDAGGGFDLDSSKDSAAKALEAVRDSIANARIELPRSLTLPDLKLTSAIPDLKSLSSDLSAQLSSLSRALSRGNTSGTSGSTSRIRQLIESLASELSKASEAAIDGLPLTPEKFEEMSSRAGRVSAEATMRLSHELDVLVATNPALLRTPVDHLRASVTHATAALEQAYAAGATLVPEEYHPLVATLAIGTASTAFGMSFAAARESYLDKQKFRNAPLTREYDLPAIMGYYNRRPLTLFSRLIEVSYRLGSLGLKLWLDRKVGDGGGWERNMEARAEEFLEFVQGAGPAFIKIGQGVSIRPDILPAPYLKELVKLQDRVKPFNSGDARDILTKQLRRPLSEVFLDADTAFEVPVAAASLGQVYRATLVSGEQVAVKVQRPDVLQSVTLDLYVIRLLLLFVSQWKSAKDSALSILGVIDNWADRFLQELDYLQEARNGDRFRSEMAASKTLGEAILVPRVYSELTTRYMLVTEWVEGVKVDAIDATTEDGRERLKKIVATLLNSYLAQLLESGFLHADPHPGNFLCTPDGRLCVLDMGLMTEIAEDQRYALLEYVSHLTAKDYEATLNDLIVLGFIPREIGDDPEKSAIVGPLLATVLEQLSNGGGAKSVTVESVGEEVEELGRQYPITIPAYFGLIIRAFSALEGLGLQLDPQYSIVNECFPYLARRLLMEDSDRMHKMLRTFLYGKDGRYLQVDRVDDLVDGYSQFTALADEASKGVTVGGVSDPLGRPASAAAVTAPTAVAAAAAGAPVDRRFGTPSVAVNPGSVAPQRAPAAGTLFGGGASVARSPAFAAAGRGANAGRKQTDPVQDPVARDALKLLFSKEGNYVQELVVEELVRMTDALSREANLQIIQALRTLTDAPLSPARIGRALAEAPLNPLLAPLQVPAKAQAFTLSRVFSRLEVALELTQEDQESLKALRRLQELLQGGINGASGDGDKSRSSPIGLPLPVPAAFSLLPGGRRGGGMGPAEAADAVRQAAGLASMIGPGVLAIAQKFVAQLAARTLDRLADSFDEQQQKQQRDSVAAKAREQQAVVKAVSKAASTTPEATANPRHTGRFYAEE